MQLDIADFPLGSKKRVIAQLAAGDLLKGLKTAVSGKVNLKDVSSEIDAVIQKLYRSGNIGTVISAYYEHGKLAGLTVDELLNRMFELKDFPGFLKQAYRFGRYIGFEEKIERSLLWHEERRLADAYAWRLKIGKLQEQERLKAVSIVSPVRVLDEEKSLEAKQATFLDLKPITIKAIEKDGLTLEEGVPGEKYYLSQVSKNKLEKANKLHAETLTALTKTLQQLNHTVKQTNLIDAYSVINGKKVIFEVKSINEGNEREQIRKAISQLYEYRFLYSLLDAVLCVVFSQKPFSQWLVNYLIEDRKIHVLWVENNRLTGNSIAELL